MSTYCQFLEARSLSEALLLKHAEEGRGRTGSQQIIDRAFQRLADELGYRVEKITADPARTLVYVDAGRPADREHAGAAR